MPASAGAEYGAGYLTWTRKVGGSIPGVATIRSVGPLSKALNPTLLQGVCLLLSLINCKSLWIKAFSS